MAPLIIGAAMGAAQLYDQQKRAAANKQYQATTARLSPWTGMRGQQVEDPSVVGTVGSGVMTGYMAQQAEDRAKAEQAREDRRYGLVPEQQQNSQDSRSQVAYNEYLRNMALLNQQQGYGQSQQPQMSPWMQMSQR